MIHRIEKRILGILLDRWIDRRLEMYGGKWINTGFITKRHFVSVSDIHGPKQKDSND